MLEWSQTNEECKAQRQSGDEAQPSSSEIDLKALILVFRRGYKSFVGLDYFRKFCRLKLKHQIFGWIRTFLVHLRLRTLFNTTHVSEFRHLCSAAQPLNSSMKTNYNSRCRNSKTLSEFLSKTCFTAFVLFE